MTPTPPAWKVLAMTLLVIGSSMLLGVALARVLVP